MSHIFISQKQYRNSKSTRETTFTFIILLCFTFYFPAFILILLLTYSWYGTSVIPYHDKRMF